MGELADFEDCTDYKVSEQEKGTAGKGGRFIYSIVPLV